MQNLRIGTSLTILLVLLAALFGTSSGVSWIGMRSTANSVERLDALNNEMQALNTAYIAVVRGRAAIAGLRSAASIGRQDVSDILVKAAPARFEEAEKSIDAFADIPRADPVEAERAKDVVSTYRVLLESSKAELKAEASGDSAAYDRISAVDSNAASRAFSTALDKFTQLSADKRNAARVDTSTAVAWQQWAIGAALLLTLLLCAWVRWALSRIIQQPLKEIGEHLDRVANGDLTATIDSSAQNEIGSLLGAVKRMQQSLGDTIGAVRAAADSVSSASTQIASGNQDLSARTEQQASSLQETAASMEELTSTVKQNADNARQANHLVASASNAASKGGEVVSRVVGTMNSIQESSRKMAEIIGTIDGIAFQTNILALNAAVEAARAGEQGRGFAVVAGEVRTLAQRSAAAAREIRALIDDSVGRVNEGNSLVEQAGVTMTEIVESVGRVTAIMGEVMAATHEQTSGIEQVNVAITQIDGATEQNAALVEEAAAAAQAMQEQAHGLTQTVRVFRLKA